MARPSYPISYFTTALGEPLMALSHNRSAYLPRPQFRLLCICGRRDRRTCNNLL